MRSGGNCRESDEILMTEVLSTARFSYTLVNGHIFEQIEKYELLAITPVQ